MNGSRPAFTVFTPTYNRAHVLHRVYESLIQQTYRDFEWLLVDDGSSDGTEFLVKRWQRENIVPIRYFFQNNGHKKIAFNHAVRLAQGEFFLTADSDDRFAPNAIERFFYHWQSINDFDQHRFQGVCCLCQDEEGNIVGDRFPGVSALDSDPMELRYRFGVRGEKWGFTRTDVLRRYPFPENLPGYVPENVVWMAIGNDYKTRFVNEVLRTYFQDSGNQITRSGDLADNAAGSLYWKHCVLSHELCWFWHKPGHFILEAARWTRFRCHSNAKKAQHTTFWPKSRAGGILIVLAAPLGLSWWLYDLFRGRF